MFPNIFECVLFPFLSVLCKLFFEYVYQVFFASFKQDQITNYVSNVKYAFRIKIEFFDEF
jgi:hypothetical protein